MKTTGTVRPFFLALRTCSRVFVILAPFERAMVFDFWMVGPSAMGSVKARPHSMTSVKHQSSARSHRLWLLTNTSPLHAQHDIWGVFNRGEAMSPVAHEGTSVLGFCLCECCFESVCHGRCEAWMLCVRAYFLAFLCRVLTQKSALLNRCGGGAKRR
jgi:hypothetical protein